MVLNIFSTPNNGVTKISNNWWTSWDLFIPLAVTMEAVGCLMGYTVAMVTTYGSEMVKTS